ncbi:DUF3299 domain-containing protein [Ideonella sp. 4Y11]|uniref:DUF3299 domain-containing protein n=1 Tax=Ideonella aquatica TaxID=2824119 RepID=A0A940YKC4_9BURK|nr:DUF3299 domain-containing protein [Ideonella aquatica]MBQ0960257.1 DUF3299 domain-containing protein [Ideonella aquatica]
MSKSCVHPRRRAVLIATAAGLAGHRAWAQGSAPRTLAWSELVPKDWDPFKGQRNRDPAKVREGSANELAMMREMRTVWDNAPTRADLEGARIRLPGYVVPLDNQPGGKIGEFLLVPYFGACIHSPPPPANQIVHVRLKTPAVWHAMDTVWVTGALATERSNTDMGVSGYALAAELVEPYKAPAR